MKLHSHGQILPDNEISVLAVTETIVVCAFSIWYAITFDQYKYLAVGTILAPFFLLRTPTSTLNGMAICDVALIYASRTFFKPLLRLRVTTKNLSNKFFFVVAAALFMIPYFLLVAIVALVSKIIATTFSTILEPTQAIRAIPENWARVCLRTDTLTVPEYVPGVESELVERYAQVKAYRFSDFLRATLGSILLRSRPRKIQRNVWNITKYLLVMALQLLLAAVFIFGSVAAYLPALIFRFSLKSSCVIYVPLLWLVNITPKSLKAITTNLLHTELEKLKRLYAWAIILTHLCSLWILFELQYISARYKGDLLVGYFFPIAEISSWHVTRIFAAAITIVLFLGADYVSKNELNLSAAAAEKLKTIFCMGMNVRTMFTIWTVSCGVYLVVTAFDWNSIPYIRWVPF